MLTYFAYGLGIRSELSLPELPISEAEADVVVRINKWDSRAGRMNAGRYSFRQFRAEVWLTWKGVGRFQIRAGREIIIECHAGIDEGILRVLLLGPALAVLLHQRGILLLHGSAIAFESGAVGFLGRTGGGKSTTAATLYAKGYPVVADDVIAIRDLAGSPFVLPAYPQLNLWPDSAASLGQDLSTDPKLHSAVEKRAMRATAGFPQGPLPLRFLYVLGTGPCCKIESLQPQTALVELLHHSYGARLLQGSAVPTHFEQCATLVRTTLIRRLTVRRALSKLHLLANLVEKDALHNAA